MRVYVPPEKLATELEDVEVCLQPNLLSCAFGDGVVATAVRVEVHK